MPVSLSPLLPCPTVFAARRSRGPGRLRPIILGGFADLDERAERLQ
jgi:hypothetical protein